MDTHQAPSLTFLLCVLVGFFLFPSLFFFLLLFIFNRDGTFHTEYNRPATFKVIAVFLKVILFTKEIVLDLQCVCILLNL